MSVGLGFYYFLLKRCLPYRIPIRRQLSNTLNFPKTSPIPLNEFIAFSDLQLLILVTHSSYNLQPDIMSFSFQSPRPSTSSPSRDNNSSTNFNVELGSFLVSLSRTADNDMSSLEQQLARLKVAWREEARKTGGAGESGEGKNAILF